MDQPKAELTPVCTFMDLHERSQKLLLSAAGFDEFSIQKILHVLASWLSEAPAVKCRKVEETCSAPSTLGAISSPVIDFARRNKRIKRWCMLSECQQI